MAYMICEINPRPFLFMTGQTSVEGNDNKLIFMKHCDAIYLMHVLLGQDGRHFADDISICIFVNKKLSNLIEISLRFVPKGPIDNIPALVKIMAWHRMGDKPLSVSMLTLSTDPMRH